jgi:hypothetical protein
MGVVRRRHRQTDSRHTVRRSDGDPPLNEATLRRMSDHGISETPVPARVLETPSGQRWLVILIARLASVDAFGETRGSRLIIRAEPLFGGHERARLVTVRATSLNEMDGIVLRDALLRPRRGERARTPRKG